MITLFENFNNIPNVNLVSDSFWKMVNIADWDSVIKGYNDNPIINEIHKNYYKDAQLRIYSIYSLSELKRFDNEYYKIYYPLYDYFPKKIEHISYDDQYNDIISSIIGKGKIFTQNCINDEKNVTKMLENNEYAENFEYLLNPSEKEYFYIKTEYKFEKEKKKYNL